MVSCSRALSRVALCPALLWISIAAAPQQSEMVIVRQSTGEYHRATCADVKDGKGVLAMTRAQAEARGFKAHAACVNAPPPSSEVESKPPKSPPVYVFTDAGKYYHRAGCAKLGPSPKKVLLATRARNCGRALCAVRRSGRRPTRSRSARDAAEASVKRATCSVQGAKFCAQCTVPCARC